MNFPRRRKDDDLQDTALADAEAMVLRDLHRRWRGVEMTTTAFANAKAMVLRDFHRRGRGPW